MATAGTLLHVTSESVQGAGVSTAVVAGQPQAGRARQAGGIREEGPDAGGEASVPPRCAKDSACLLSKFTGVPMRPGWVSKLSTRTSFFALPPLLCFTCPLRCIVELLLHGSHRRPREQAMTKAGAYPSLKDWQVALEATARALVEQQFHRTCERGRTLSSTNAAANSSAC